MTGGLISKALPDGARNLAVWTKNWLGQVITVSAEPASGSPVTIAYIAGFDYPRPDVHWALDDSTYGYVNGNTVMDTMSMASGTVVGATQPKISCN